MNILEHPLVKKYFSCEENCLHTPDSISGGMHRALRVITAMSADVKKGDRYLYSHSDDGLSWKEETRTFGWLGELIDFHPHNLRLPDRFQTKPDLVESKISEILWPGVNDEVRWPRREIEIRLRELVKLVKSS